MPEYHKLAVPTMIMQYECPAISGMLVIALVFVVRKILQAQAMQRSVKVMLYLSCLEFLLLALFWFDYYLNTPLWLYGLLEFWPSMISVSIMERLGSSWYTGYKRHNSSLDGLPTYSKVLQRSMLALSLLDSGGMVVLFSVGYALSVPSLRFICRVYYLASLWVFMVYVQLAAVKLVTVIDNYVGAKYSKRIKGICLYIGLVAVLKTLVLVYFMVRDGNDIDEFISDGFSWLVYVLYPIITFIGIGFAILISKLIMVKKKEVACNGCSEYSSYLEDNEKNSTSIEWSMNDSK